MTTNVYPKSTVEFIHLPITKAGVVQTTGVTYSVVQMQPGDTTAPEGTHSPATIFEGKTGIVISFMAPGLYKVWGAVTTGPTEYPHVYLGTFRVTD
jgi:hypothetical protein